MQSNKNSPSITAVKGHLVNKSSPLSTESCKLNKQFIIAQNMASHYKRVINAKPVIDISPPKTLTTSQKARDRVKREMLRFSMSNKALERAKSAEAARLSMQGIQDDKSESESKSLNTVSLARSSKSAHTDVAKSRLLPDQHKLNKSMSEMVTNFTKHAPQVKTYKPKQVEIEDNMNKSQFVNPLASSRSLTEQEKNAKNVLSTLLFNVTSNNESMSIPHPALKAMSRLVSGHNYDVLDNHATKFKQPEKEFQPRIVKSESSSSKLKGSSCYEPPRRRKKSANVSETNMSKQIDDEYEPSETGRSNKSYKNNDDNDDYQPEFNNKKLNNSGLNNILNTSTTSKHIETTSQTNLRRTAEKEEELKYLEFIKTVTDDILARGITSNRVINNCFEYHIKQNRDRLNERKMRELLDNLRDDIGISKENEIDIGDNYYQTVNKAILLDKERNKENMNDVTNIGTEYLTLRKFGFSTLNKTQVDNLNRTNSTEKNKNIWNMIEDDLGQNTNNNDLINKSMNSKLYDEYENQIIKNIQSIRRNSTEGVIVEKSQSGNNSRKSSTESIAKTVQKSILKKSNSQTSIELNRKDSKDSKDSLIRNNEQNFDDDDDDDDLYVVSQKWTRSDDEDELSQTKLISNSKLNKSEYTDDVLFNDNYGEDKVDEKSDDNSDDDDDDDDDNFDQLLQKKSLQKSKERQASVESNKSGNDRSETPTPRPRRSLGFNKQDQVEQDDTEDEDDF